MGRESLVESWAVTRRHLGTAEQIIASLPAIAAHTTQMAAYRSWLEHNELELALDDLAEVGESLDQAGTLDHSSQFWEALERAAGNMGLEKKAERFRHQRENGR